MRILVTNDDGIDSPGLHALSRRLTEVGRVTVFAPSYNASGASAAIGHIGPGLPDVFAADIDELGDVDAAYHFEGPPALAVLLAGQGIFGEPPDVVVSGINPGWNVGRSVHFSGTVGACITGHSLGIPGIAVSQRSAETPDEQRWETAAEVAADLLDEVRSPIRLLNVNVPNLATGDLAGARYTELGSRLPYSLHSPSLTTPDDGRHQADFERFGPYDSPDGSDTDAVERGYVSITPLTPTSSER